MNGKVDFFAVRTASREILSKMLEELPGNKAIVWEKELAGTFSLVGDFSFLRNHGVSQMFYLNADHATAPSSPNTHVIFITKPRVQSMDYVNTYIRSINTQQQPSSGRQMQLWLVPRSSLLCERRLQEHSALEFLAAIKELPLLLFTLESDLVSMELPTAFAETVLDKDLYSTHLAARALLLLQGLFGLIPSIRGKGPNVSSLYNMMVELRREMGHEEPQITPKIDQLIVIERSVDLITPLTTQLTYEGLIDQCFGITNCVVKLPSSKLQSGSSSDDQQQQFGSLPDSEQLKSVLLSSSDPLYQELRDANFTAVGPKLASQAKQITREFEERHQAKTVVEMKQFVQKLPRIQAAKQSLALHTSLAEAVQEELSSSFFCPALKFEQELLRGSVDCDKPSAFIEECLGRQAPLLTVLRLMCLQSIISNGLKQKLLDYYRREVIQTYGYQHIVTLDNLSMAGLLTLQTNKSTYITTRKTLRLIVDDVNELHPTDISYVHSGYAPVSVRLARYVHNPGWRAIPDLMNIMPGRTLAETQHVGRHRRTGSSGGLEGDDSAPVVLVLFLGGCTYSEVAALRFLSSKSQEEGGPEYVIMTTGLHNSSTFLRSLSTTLLQEQSSLLR